jgi:hypothetical protein
VSSRSDDATRKAAVTLSALLLTPDDGLASFRNRRVADSEIDVGMLRRARDLLDAVSNALSSRDAQRWRRIEEAWRVLERDARNRPATSAPSDPTSKPTRAAENRSEVASDAPGALPISLLRPSAPLQGPVVTVSPDPRDATQPIDRRALNLGSPLPFRGAASPPLPSKPEPPHSAVGETSLESLATVRPALPFEELAGGEPSWTLEQFASLCAEIDLHPAQLDRTRARFGLRDAAHEAAVRGHWNARIAGDAQLKRDFERSYEQYQRWLREHRR